MKKVENYLIQTPSPIMIIYSLYLFSFWMSKLYFLADSVHFFKSSEILNIGMITERVECLECRFCHGLVGTEAGEVRKLERHLVDTHDILFNKQLSLATFFITTEEVATILANLEPRINIF